PFYSHLLAHFGVVLCQLSLLYATFQRITLRHSTAIVNTDGNVLFDDFIFEMLDKISNCNIRPNAIVTGWRMRKKRRDLQIAAFNMMSGRTCFASSFNPFKELLFIKFSISLNTRK